MHLNLTALSPSGSEERSVAGRTEAMAVAAILALHIVLVWALRVPSMTTGNDQAWYMLLARSLRHLSYENLQFVEVTPHTKFPPAYPAFLSLLGVTTFDRFDLGIAANAILSATALALTYGIVRRVSRVIAWFVVAVSSVNPLVVSVAGSLLSEPLFMALSALAFWELTRHEQTRQSASIAIAALIAASLTRPIGITFIFAGLLLWAFQRRWRWMMVLGLASALTTGTWLAWSATAAGKHLAGQSYLADAIFAGKDAQRTDTTARSVGTSSLPEVPGARRARASASGILAVDDRRASVGNASKAPPHNSSIPLPTGEAASMSAETNPSGEMSPIPTSFTGVLARRAMRNVSAISLRSIPAVLAIPLRSHSTTDRTLWLTATVVLLVAGLGVLALRLPALVLGTGAYVALLVLWPYVLLRYMGPVIPAILALLFVGALALGDRAGLKRGWGRYALPGLLALAFTSLALVQDIAKLRAVAACNRARAASSPTCFGESPNDFFAAVSAVRELPDDSANFLVSKEALFHALTGRHAAWEAEAAQIREPTLLADFLRRQHVSYVLLSTTNLNQWSLAKPLNGLCTRLRVIGEFGPKVSLLQIVEQDAPGTNACPQVAKWAAPPWPEGPPLIW